MNKELMRIDFHNDRIFLVEQDGEPYVPVRPVTDNLGLAWKPQYMKLMSNQKRWSVTIMVTVALDGKQRDMVCMPLKKYPAFINSIAPRKCKRQIRAKLEAYQEESDNAMWDYWSKGKAVNPRLVESDADDELERIRYPQEIDKNDARLWRSKAIEYDLIHLFSRSVKIKRRPFLRAMGFRKAGATKKEASAMIGVSVRLYSKYERLAQVIVNEYKMSATEQLMLHDFVAPLHFLGMKETVPPSRQVH